MDILITLEDFNSGKPIIVEIKKNRN